MKKVLWIIGTIAAGFLLTMLIGFVTVGITIIIGIITRSGPPDITSTMGVVMLLAWIALIIVSIRMYKRWEIRCPACKRWGAIGRIKTESINQADIYVPVTVERRNLDGHVTGTQDQYIPGKRTTYRDTYKCKYCGHLQGCIRTADSKNI